MTLRWVVLETGANQAFVFGSNRMRHVVGASQLVLDAGTTWVEQALLGLDDVEPVQLISGKAILLVRTAEAGREVIRAVSRRALAEAPGLEVTGAVGPEFDQTLPYRAGGRDPAAGQPDRTGVPDRPDRPEPPETSAAAVPGSPDVSGPLRRGEALNHVEALRRTFELQRRARAKRPPQQIRDRFLPWHQPCSQTGTPTEVLEYFGADPDDPASQDDPGSTWQPVGAAVRTRAVAFRKDRTRERLRELLGEDVATAPKMIDDLTGEGWIAVVHADGNGVGGLFHTFPDLVAAALRTEDLSLEDHCRWLRTFSEALDEATRAAFRRAVEETAAGFSGGGTQERIMPIVVGGDDVTFVCHAQLALPLVRSFLWYFAEETARRETLSRIVAAHRRSPGPEGLTAAAGIAFVKRHHPFSVAYELAEDLTASAKSLLRPVSPEHTGPEGISDGPVAAGAASRQLSVYDVHVAFESTLQDLTGLRDDLVLGDGNGGRVHRHAGPFVLPDGDGKVPNDLRHRDERHLTRLLRALAEGDLSAARAHDLREALDRGLPEYESRCRVVLTRARSEQKRDDRHTSPGRDAVVPAGGRTAPRAPDRPDRWKELEQLLAPAPAGATGSGGEGGLPSGNGPVPGRPAPGRPAPGRHGGGDPGWSDAGGHGAGDVARFVRIVDAILLQGVTG